MRKIEKLDKDMDKKKLDALNKNLLESDVDPVTEELNTAKRLAHLMSNISEVERSNLYQDFDKITRKTDEFQEIKKKGFDRKVQSGKKEEALVKEKFAKDFPVRSKHGKVIRLLRGGKTEEFETVLKELTEKIQFWEEENVLPLSLEVDIKRVTESLSNFNHLKSSLKKAESVLETVKQIYGFQSHSEGRTLLKQNDPESGKKFDHFLKVAKEARQDMIELGYSVLESIILIEEKIIKDRYKETNFLLQVEEMLKKFSETRKIMTEKVIQKSINPHPIEKRIALFERLIDALHKIK